MITWKEALESEAQKPYFIELLNKVNSARETQSIYPNRSDVFRAFKLTPLSEVKVVILGQDPYHGPGQANGLAFSVNKGLKIPPSLMNIFRAMRNDGLLTRLPLHGDLTPWARQGVFLLNTTLTVAQANANAHANWGWTNFTDKVLSILNAQSSPIAFMLWGSFAQKKEAYLTHPHHLILKAPHPSPLSAHRGFLTAKNFQNVSEFLNNQGVHIDWSLD